MMFSTAALDYLMAIEFRVSTYLLNPRAQYKALREVKKSKPMEAQNSKFSLGISTYKKIA